MDINNLVRQHNEVVDLIDKISTYQRAEQVKVNASEISNMLARLSGIIKMHLTSEDKFLYPLLIKHTDIKIRNTAKDFINEMGELAKVFEKYKMKFLGSSKIAENAADFLVESKIVFSALSERIKKENSSLYPLVK